MSKRKSTANATAKASTLENPPECDSPKWTDVETKRLEHLLEKGTVKLTDPASLIRVSDNLFLKYSNHVVGYQLGLLRRKKLTKPGPVHNVLSQLGVVASVAPSVDSISTKDVVDIESYGTVVCENMPFIRFNYMNYADKQEKVVVLLDLPGGSGNFDWLFNDIGDEIIVSIDWSKALCNVSNLFNEELKSKRLSLDHPKLHAMQDQLVKDGISVEHVPRCVFRISLGRRVHKDDDTWLVDSFTHEGNKILMFEFSGFQEEVLKKAKRGSFL